MSQQSWMKNTCTKCHRLWDKILQGVGISRCDKPSKFTRSECHNLGWTNNQFTLRRNVTGANCHSRRFVGWTDSVGRNVVWSVRGWTDRQGTVSAATCHAVHTVYHNPLTLPISQHQLLVARDSSARSVSTNTRLS